jgi:hypothetical protein
LLSRQIFVALLAHEGLCYCAAMTEPNAIDAASRRLALALDALAAAVERRRSADAVAASLSAQLHALGSDRSRLAAELDEALARARSLESVNRDVARRLESAIAAIRSLVDR